MPRGDQGGKALVRVVAPFRGWTLYSLFVATAEQRGKIDALCDERETVYFGEIGGKHSDIEARFDREDFEVVSEDQGFIARFEESVGSHFGVNFLEYIGPRCERCGDRFDGDGAYCPYCRDSETTT